MPPRVNTFEDAELKADVRTGEECWQWRGLRSRDGYGVYRFEGKYQRAHRIFYKSIVGPLSSKHQIHHRCRNRLCVNPQHMEVVTPQIHLQITANIRMEITHCKHGHPYQPGVVDERGARKCLICKRISCNSSRARRMEEYY